MGDETARSDPKDAARSGLKQSHFRYVGVAFVLVPLLLVVAFGPPPASDPFVTVPWAAMAVSGAFLALAGSVAEVSVGPVTLGWRALAGTGLGVFGVTLPLNYVRTVELDPVSGTDLLLFGSAVLGGVVVLAFAVDLARGGRHFRVVPDVERRV